MKTLGEKACDLVRKNKGNVSVLKSKPEFTPVKDKKDGNDLITVFSDGSALIHKCFYNQRVKPWFTFTDYLHDYNDRTINQGFPVNSNKKDFVNGSVVEVMWDDQKEPELTLIIEMEKRPHNFKGDFDIRGFSLSRYECCGFSQTQIKRLVTKSIDTMLKESSL